MFEKKIYIKDEHLIHGKREIEWSRIVGIKVHSGKVFERISPNFPRVDMYLEDGRVVVVSNRNVFFCEDKGLIEYRKITCTEAIEMINDKAINSKPVFNDRFEWRVLLSVAIFEIIALLIGIINGLKIDHLVLFAIAFGIVGAIVGLFFERKIRRRLCDIDSH